LTHCPLTSTQKSFAELGQGIWVKVVD
jgi:hypothetical protein